MFRICQNVKIFKMSSMQNQGFCQCNSGLGEDIGITFFLNSKGLLFWQIEFHLVNLWIASKLKQLLNNSLKSTHYSVHPFMYRKKNFAWRSENCLCKGIVVVRGFCLLIGYRNIRYWIRQFLLPCGDVIWQIPKLQIQCKTRTRRVRTSSNLDIFTTSQ